MGQSFSAWLRSYAWLSRVQSSPYTMYQRGRKEDDSSSGLCLMWHMQAPTSKKYNILPPGLQTLQGLSRGWILASLDFNSISHHTGPNTTQIPWKSLPFKIFEGMENYLQGYESVQLWKMAWVWFPVPSRAACICNRGIQCFILASSSTAPMLSGVTSAEFAFNSYHNYRTYL